MYDIISYKTSSLDMYLKFIITNFKGYFFFRKDFKGYLSWYKFEIHYYDFELIFLRILMNFSFHHKLLDLRYSIINIPLLNPSI